MEGKELTVSAGKDSMMPMSATPPIKFPAPSRIMLHTADRWDDIDSRPSVRIPNLPVSSAMSLPNPSLPTGERRRVAWESEDDGLVSVLCAASAIFRPTPPSVVVIWPGLVECLPKARLPSDAREVISTAADPITMSLTFRHINHCITAKLRL